jgi:ABC-type sulfate transport system permease component
MSTKTAPLYIYGEVEGFNLEGALAVSLVLLGASLLSLLVASRWAEQR